MIIDYEGWNSWKRGFMVEFKSFKFFVIQITSESQSARSKHRLGVKVLCKPTTFEHHKQTKIDYELQFNQSIIGLSIRVIISEFKIYYHSHAFKSSMTKELCNNYHLLNLIALIDTIYQWKW